MIISCPICGNNFSLRPNTDRKDGWCPYCKRDYEIKKIKRKGKYIITLEEKIKEDKQPS